MAVVLKVPEVDGETRGPQQNQPRLLKVRQIGSGLPFDSEASVKANPCKDFDFYGPD